MKTYRTHVSRISFYRGRKGYIKKPHYIRVIYRSPESSLTDFNDNLENVLIKIDRENKDSLLSGDYNVNTLHELSCHHICDSRFYKSIYNHLIIIG